MSAHSDENTGVPEVSMVEFEEKSGLNSTLCDDLPKIGGDCNDIVHASAEVDDGEPKDDGDSSYVFVDDADTISDDPVERDLDTECLVELSETVEGESVVVEKTVMEFDLSSRSMEKQVTLEELKVQEGGNSDSCNKENLVSFSKHDVNAEGSECQTNGVEVAVQEQNKSDISMEQKKLESTAMVEENQKSLTTGTECIESDPYQLDNEEMVGLEAVVEENPESAIMVTETAESELHQFNDREGRVERKTRLESVAELEENEDHSQITIPDAVESKLHKIDDGEEKVEEKIEVESAEEPEKNQETTKLVDEIPVEGHSGCLKAERELDLEIINCPLDDSQLDPEATLGTDKSDCINDVIDVANEGDQSISGESDGKPICVEIEGIEGIDSNGSQPSSPEDSTTAALEEQKVDEDVRKKPFHFLIRIPRYVDDKIKDQISLALLHVNEKTRSRDAIRAAIQSKRAICSEYHNKFEAARSEERAARDALNAKRQEMDSIQLVINRMKNATSIEDIADRMHNMEHRIEHETMPLKEEKQLIREIKQLKHLREQLCSSLGGRQAEIQPTLDQRDRAEERFKLLKQELDSTRNEVLQTEGITKASRKIYFDESEKLKELQAQFRAADDLRQEAYTHLQNLKKQLYEKNKYFRMYKEELQKAEDYASVGDTEGLEQLCVNQVNTIMEQWNKYNEFRNEYVRCNTMSTLRRLGTLDGRSLGPDEDPPLLRNVVNERVDNTLVTLEHGKSAILLEHEKAYVKCEVNVEQKNPKADVKSVVNLEQKNPAIESKKASKPIALEIGSVTVSDREESEKKIEAANMRTKEEEELARKAEELRKEEAAAKLKQQRRLEEKAKAKEAEARKRRNAEKAQARAELRAQKEAELKEKEREKRARKKEKKKTATAEVARDGIKGESASSSEIITPLATTQEPEIIEKASAVAKRPQKPPQLSKQTKTKTIPPPLRNRSKRRMQPWIWVLLTALVVVGLFLVGNSYFSKFGLSSFGF